MWKRICEDFIEKHFCDKDYVVKKTYTNNKLTLVTITNDESEKSVHIYDDLYYSNNGFKDTDTICYLGMDELEDRLAQKDGIGDMIELITYYLEPEMVDCLCVDYGDFVEFERIDYAFEDEEYIIKNHIRPILLGIGAIDADDDDSLACVLEDALFHDKKITLCGVTMYYASITKQEYEEAEDL